jgi:putative oxidoreductase
MTALMLLGRVLFAGYFLYSGITHFTNSKNLHAYTKSKGIPLPEIAVLATGVMLIVGGAGLLLNIYIQQCLILLLAFMIPTTFSMHAFWKQGHEAEKVSFMKNLALIGALLMFLY